ncbi:predicted protein [Lichtheimia corymbifera JMRC:FSU:9682]|uniref:C2H2-type domain-containing protein n=1 Tax=Lichtheimia corymbifera JMRC:FSU:9682 TaxID=1263082 RepID=A0A068S4P0_9FUNG|nr:predicted protein [Lichtheimia corymbifera JMRC:FSU:9682]
MTTVNIHPGHVLQQQQQQQQQGVLSYTDLLCSQANFTSASYDNDFSSLLSYDGGDSSITTTGAASATITESCSIAPVTATMTTCAAIPSSASGGNILEAPFSPITPIMHPLYFQQQQQQQQQRQQSTQPQECNTPFVGPYGNTYMSHASFGPYILDEYGAEDTTAAMQQHHHQQQQESLYSSSSAPPSLMPLTLPFKHVEHASQQQQHTMNNYTIAAPTTNDNNGKKSISPPATTTTQPRSRGRRVSSVPTQGERMFVCQTEGCGKVFKRSEHLKRHTRSIHTLEKRKWGISADTKR